MDVKEAVKVAKLYVADLMADEQISNIALEEVEFDPDSSNWKVTIGFDRFFQPNSCAPNQLMELVRATNPVRLYRLVTISEKDQRVVSFKQREGLN